MSFGHAISEMGGSLIVAGDGNGRYEEEENAEQIANNEQAPSTDPAEKVQGYKYPVSLLPHIPDTNNAVRTG